jgi:hypothetical protein
MQGTEFTEIELDMSKFYGERSLDENDGRAEVF